MRKQKNKNTKGREKCWSFTPLPSPRGNYTLLFLFFMLFLVGISQKGYSQSDSRLMNRRYKMEDGLSSNRVYSIVQDSLGFIWIGTSNGLDRFDGANFKKYNFNSSLKNSISSNEIHKLIIAKDQRMWIGLDNGVDIYDPHTGAFTHFTKKTNSGVSINGSVQDLIQDEEGYIWIGTQTDGLFRYSPEKDTLTAFKHIPGDSTSLSQNRIMALCEGNNGNIWVGTYNEGISVWSKNTEKFTRYTHTIKGESLSDNAIQAIFKDTYGNIWIGTFNQGIDRFDRDSEEFIHYHNSDLKNLLYHVHDIYEFERGKLMVASDKGVSIFKTETGDLKYDKELNEKLFQEDNRFVYSLFKDKEGGVWLGYYFEGLRYLFPKQVNFSNFSCKTEDGRGKVINCFVEDEKGIYWVGTDDNGLYRFNSNNQTVTPVRTGDDIHSFYYCIHDLVIDGDRLLAATYGRGLEVFDLRGNYIKSYMGDPDDSTALPSSRLFSLFKDHRGRVYVGTSKGLCYYNEKEDHFVRMKPKYLINDIVERDNDIWIATLQNGLYRYNTKNNTYKHYPSIAGDTTSLPSNNLSTLAVDDKDRLWIGTNGYGICQYDSGSDRFIRFPNLHLPNKVISGIIPVQEKIWSATKKGLVRWNKKTKEEEVFSRASGIYNEQFSKGAELFTQNGMILLGSAEGFSFFNPNNLEKNDYNSPIFISNLSINGKPVSPFTEESPINLPIEYVKKMTLPYDKSTISVSFASLSYIDPQEIEYKYKLEGLEDKWHYTDGINRNVTYANLPAGKYHLKVKGTNSDKVWSTHTATINIVVKPYFLMSKAAIAIYVILVLVAIYFVIKQNNRRRDSKHAREVKAIEQESERQAYESKISFFTHIAHEIRTPLSLIIGPLEEISKSQELSDAYSEYFSIMELNSKRLRRLVTQLLDFRKIDAGKYRMTEENCNFSTFMTEVLSLFSVRAKRNHIQLSVDTTSVNKEYLIYKEALTKIMSNIISNSLKYAENSIDIKALEKDNNLIITIKDDGPGIPSALRNKIFKPFYKIKKYNKVTGTGLGLYMTKSLVEQMGGEITVVDESEEGTLMKIVLPVRRRENLNEVEFYKEDAKLLDNLDTLLYQEEETNFEEEESEPEQRNKDLVLIVDDNLELLKFLSDILKKEYVVFSASNAEEALLALKNNEFDLIISDIVMGEVSGLELCRKVKLNINTSHIPFVLLTAKTNTKSKVRGLDYGSDAYIEKPFSPSHLRAQLKNLLKKREHFKSEFSHQPSSDMHVTTYSEIDEEWIEKCTDIVTENMDSPEFNIDYLTKEMAMSRTAFFTKVKAITGMTPNAFIKLIRLKNACKIMEEGRYKVSEIGFLVGFNSSSYFAKCFADQFGVPPKEYMERLEKEI